MNDLSRIRSRIKSEKVRIKEIDDIYKYKNYINMSDEEIKDALRFHGEKCCMFSSLDPKNDADAEIMSNGLERIKCYGESLTYEDHVVISWFTSASEGKRYLCRCKNCGALFIEQNDRDSVSFGEDDYYTNDHHYYQIESEEHAIKLNLLLDSKLGRYKAPHFSTYKNG